MYEYLRSELKGLELDQALEVESVKEFMQDLFQKVFTARPAEPIPTDRKHYPELQVEKMDQLMR